MEEEYYQNQNQYMPQQMPYPVESGFADAGLLSEWLSVEEFYEEMEHKLKGELPVFERDDENRVRNTSWVSADGSAWMNNLGVHQIMACIRSTVTRNTFLSNFSDERINQIMKGFLKTISELIAYNYREYNLSKLRFDSLVNNIIKVPVESAMRRSAGALTVRTLGSKTNIIHQRVERPTEEKSGFLGVFGKRRY